MSEWVKESYCIGFITRKGLMLDLDDCSLRKTTHIAEHLLKQHKLEGYLIIRSSPKHYHEVFDRYLTWRKIGMILMNQYLCIRWGIWQIKKGELTVRISAKNKKNIPEIIKAKGKQNKLIKEYLDTYYYFNPQLMPKTYKVKLRIP